jgi:LysR family transcriptional regulator for bpeEF and oprC
MLSQRETMGASPLDLFAGVVPFVAVSEARSFRVAARRLGVTAPAVSKAIAKLEADLGVRLLRRTSRSVTVTTEGEAFLRKCRAAVDDVRAARALLSESQQAPRGLLRVSLPHTLGRSVMSELPRLLSAHPSLAVHAVLTDRFVQLSHENVDVALRVGGLADSSCIGRRLRHLRLATAASPGYLAAHGIPRAPEDLAGHNCLKFLLQTGVPLEWRFGRGSSARAVAVRGNLTADHGESLVAAATAGLGILQAPDIMIAGELARKDLVEVLAEQAAPAPPLTAICAPGSQAVPKVRLFLGFLVELFGSAPRPRDEARRTA